MTKKLPPGLRLNSKKYVANFAKRASVRPEEVSPKKNGDTLDRKPTETRGRGVRNTSYRLPYLSNLRKMDPVFDDPYDVAAQTIRRNRKPGDPEVVLDPDGLYEEDDAEGDDSGDLDGDLPEHLTPPNKFEEFDQSHRFKALMEATGLSMEYIEKLMKRPLVYKFVSNQTRTGKIRSLYCLTVVGNGNGMVGYGEGKADEHASATEMATIQAIKRMVPVYRYEDRTVYGDVEGKFEASRVSLRARPPGFGIRAQYYVHEVCRCAGISDVGAKVRGSMNGMNIVKAVFEALRQQKLPDTIAKQRGIHVVDVRERYFHGR
jgi:small subunit ribosomal protein S5